MTASPGVEGSEATRSLSSIRIWAAMALPSMSFDGGVTVGGVVVALILVSPVVFAEVVNARVVAAAGGGDDDDRGTGIGWRKDDARAVIVGTDGSTALVDI